MTEGEGGGLWSSGYVVCGQYMKIYLTQNIVIYNNNNSKYDYDYDYYCVWVNVV